VALPYLGSKFAALLITVTPSRDSGTKIVVLLYFEGVIGRWIDCHICLQI
jgi:hypothetical protein